MIYSTNQPLIQIGYYIYPTTFRVKRQDNNCIFYKIYEYFYITKNTAALGASIK